MTKSVLQPLILDALMERRRECGWGKDGPVVDQRARTRHYFRHRYKDLRQELRKIRDKTLLARLRSPFE